MFENRQDAGQKLANELQKLSLSPKDSIILALPRGGVVLGAKVAEILSLPLDIIVVRKIGHPLNQEYAVGALGAYAQVLNQIEKIDKTYLKSESQRERKEVQRRLNTYRGKKPFPSLKNKNIVLVDDGLATGLTMRVALEEVKFFKPKRIIIAVPVAPPGTYNNLKNLVNDIVVLELEPNFLAIGQFYKSFEQISDEEVIKLLSEGQKRIQKEDLSEKC